MPDMQPRDPEEKPNSQAPDAHRWRTLLVDDSPTILRHLRRFLVSRPQFEVIATAASGLEAVQAAQKLRPDVIFMDLLMPGLSGFEAAAWIRQALPDVRVIVMSVLDADTAQAAALDSGADGFLPKTEFYERFDEEVGRVLQPRSGVGSGPRPLGQPRQLSSFPNHATH